MQLAGISRSFTVTCVKDGINGTSDQTIYKVSNNYPYSGANPSPSGGDTDVPSGWSRNIQGVSQTYPFLYASTRQKVNGSWTSWSGPQLITKWAADGTSLNIKGSALGVIAWGGHLPSPSSASEGDTYLHNDNTGTDDIDVLENGSWEAYPVDLGDCYIVDGDLWIKQEEEATQSKPKWVNIGRIKGDPGEDAVTYEIRPHVDSVTIPSGNSTATLNSASAFFRKVGSAAATSYWSYYAVYTRSGSTYTLVSSGSESGVYYNITVTTAMDAVVVFMFSSAYSSTDPTLQNYLCKKEILVKKNGNNGANGANAIFYKIDASINSFTYTQDAAGNQTYTPSVFNLTVSRANGSNQVLYTDETDLPSGVIVYWKTAGMTWEEAIEDDNEQALGGLTTASEFSGNAIIDYGVAVNGNIVSECRISSTREYYRLLMPQGVYDANTTYTRTATTTPLVLYKNNGTDGYYYLIKDSNLVQGSRVAPTNTSVWAQANSYEVVLTKMLFAENATLGMLIIYKKWMYSQCGYILKSFASDPGDTWTLYENHRDYDVYKKIIDETNYNVAIDSLLPYGYFNEYIATQHTSTYCEFFPNYSVNMLTGATIQGNTQIEGVIKARTLATDVVVITNSNDTTFYNTNLAYGIISCASLVVWNVNASGNATGSVSLPDPATFTGVKIRFIGPFRDSTKMILNIYGPTPIGVSSNPLYTVSNTYSYVRINDQSGSSSSSSIYNKAHVEFQSDGSRWWIISATNVHGSAIGESVALISM